jgi:trigger factor
LDELLEGAEPGKEVRKTRSYPTDYSEKEIAGKNVEWRATVKDIYERIIPALDDEFAKDQGEYQNLDELRAAIRKDLERQAEQEADQRVRQGLVDLIAERNPLELPESLVTRELRSMEAEAVATLEAAGIDRDSALQRVQQDAEAMRTRAEKRARSALIVDAIADQENIAVTDDEVADRVAAMVQQSGGRNRERMAEFYSREENRAALKQVMRREKTLDMLLNRAQIEEQPVGASEPPSPPEAASSET